MGSRWGWLWVAVLAGGLLFGLGSAAWGAPTESVPESATGDPEVVPEGAELLEVTPTSRRWREANGTIGEQRSMGPVFYDTGGPAGWEAIDVSLVESADSRWLQGRSVPDGVAQIASEVSSDRATVVVGDHDGAGQVQVRYPGMAGVGSVRGTVAQSGSEVEFPSALSRGRDLRVQLLADGFKDSVVVGDRAGGSSFRVQFTLPAGWSARQVEGGVEFVDADGQVAAAYGGGLAFDAAVTPSEVPVTVSLLAQDAATVMVEVSVDRSWFDAEERVFPVTLDPTYYNKSVKYFKTDGEQERCSGSTYTNCDTYVNSDNFNGAYWEQNELRVGSNGLYEQGTTSLARSRTFVMFSSDNMGNSPYRYDVTSATLRLYAWCCKDRPSGTFYAHASKDWPDKYTTWGNQPAAGSYISSEYGPDTGYFYWNVESWGDAWLNGSATNYGIRIRAYDEDNTNYLRKFRSWNTGYSSAPLLTMYYTVKAPLADPRYPSSGTYTTTSPSYLRAYYTDPQTHSGHVVFQVQYKSGSSWYWWGTSAKDYVSHQENAYWNDPGLPVNTYRWRTRAENYHGAWSYSDWQDLTVHRPANTPTLVAPSDGRCSTSPPSTLTGKYSDPDGHAGQLYFVLYQDGVTGRIDQGWSTKVASGSNVSWSGNSLALSGLGPGRYTWTAKAKDEHGGTTHTYPPRWAFTVNRVPDVPALRYPANGATFTSPPSSLQADYTDPDGHAGRLLFRVYNSAGSLVDSGWSTQVTSGSTASWSPSVSLTGGTYTWQAKAQDSCGAQSSYSAKRSFTVDGSAPPVPTVSSSSHRPAGSESDPTTDRWFNSADIALSWTAHDPESGIAGYSRLLDATATTVSDRTSEGTATSTTATAAGSGTWWFHVRAVNGVGTWGDSAHFQANVDIDAPDAPAAVTSTSHIPSVGSSQRTIEVDWTAGDDAHSGVAGYSWTFNRDQTVPADATADGDAGTRQASYEVPAGEDGTWWFHVSTIDAAGNQSADTVYGPIVIDSDSSILSPTVGDQLAGSSDEVGLEGWFPVDGHDVGLEGGFVQLRTGNLAVDTTDETVPSEGLNVVVGRAYNSHRADPQLLDALERPGGDTGLGRGWSLSVADADAGLDGAFSGIDANAGVAVATIYDDTGAATGRVVEFVDGDATTHRFVRHGPPGTAWQTPPGLDLRIVEHVDTAGQPTGYQFHRTDGVVYTADTVPLTDVGDDVVWRITEMSDRHGNRIVYTYDNYTAPAYDWMKGQAVLADLNGDGTLEQVTVPVVRLEAVYHSRAGLPDTAADPLVDFVWTADATLDRIVTLPGHTATDPGDPAGSSRSWERATEVTVDTVDGGRMVDVTHNAQTADVTAGRRTTSYGYDTGGRLTTISDPHATITTGASSTLVGYDAAGRVTSLTDREGGVWAYGYLDNADGTRTTTVTDPAPDPADTVYDISARGNVSTTDGRLAGGNITKITDPGAGAGTVATSYSWQANRLVRSVDAAGQATSQTYDGLGQLASRTRPAPNAVRATLPGNAPTSTATDRFAWQYSDKLPVDDCATAPASTTDVTLAGCYAVADLIQVAAADDIAGQRRVTDYTVDAATGNVTRIVQRGPDDATSGDDRTVTLDYYSSGALKQLDGPRTDVTDVTVYGDTTDAAYGGYHRTGRPTQITDAAGNQVTADWTAYGQLARQTDQAGRTVYRRYNDRDLLVAAVDPRGESTRNYDRYTTTHTHDALDLRTSATEPGGLVTTFGYDRMERSTATVEDGQQVSATVYNDDGTTAQETNAAGGTTTYQWWPNHAIRQQTAPADGTAAVTDWAYDTAGRIATITGPQTTAGGERPTTTRSYTPSSQVASETTTAPDGGTAIVEFAYDAHGQTVQTLGPRTDEESRRQFDTFGQNILLRRADGPSSWLDTSYRYDLAGNLLSTTQPAGPDGPDGDLTTGFDYDVLGRLIEQTDPTNDHETAYTWTPDGRQDTKIERRASDGTDLRTVDVDYNPDDTVVRQTATEHTTGDVLVACAFSADGTGLGGHDDAGNLLGLRTVRNGNAGDRCAGGTVLAEQTYRYDTRNRTIANTQKVRSPDTGTMVVRDQTFAYNNDGTLRQLSHDGKTVDYTHTTSGSGWLKQINDWTARTSTYGWLPSGAPTSVTRGTSVTGTHGWLPDGSLGSLTWTHGTTTVRSHTALGYDNGRQLLAETVDVLMPDSTRESGTAGFAYDAARRLTAWTSPFAYEDGAGQPSTGYTLDEGGNVTSETVTVDAATRKTATYTYVANQLQAITVDEPAHGTDPQRITDTTLGYNALGDETVRDTSIDIVAPGVGVVDRHTERGYDPAGYVDTIGRTVTGELNSNFDVDYTYDLTDRPLTRTATGDGADEDNAGTRVYFYVGATGIRVEEADATGDTTTTFLVDDRLNPIAQQTHETDDTGNVVTGGQVDWIWLLTDTHGNTATLLNDDGTVVEQVAYDPYGAPDDGGSSRLQDADGDPLTDDWIPTSSLGFQSAPTDADTGNVILGPRQYDPATRHFTTSDRYLPAGMDMALRVDPLTGNQYIFAAANPVAHHDDGHSVIEGHGNNSYTPTPSTTDVYYDKPHGHHVSRESVRRDARQYEGERYTWTPGHYPGPLDVLRDSLLYVYRHMNVAASYCYIACGEAAASHGKVITSGGGAGLGKFALSAGWASAVPHEQTAIRFKTCAGFILGLCYVEGERSAGDGLYHGVDLMLGFGFQAGYMAKITEHEPFGWVPWDHD